MRVYQTWATLAWFSNTASAFSGRHEAHRGLLQVPPSFSHDGVNMYPALHPNHDSDDLNHLVPEGSKQLYYSQEGHRPAFHGAKHSNLNVTFVHPTVVLEHSSHVEEVNCGNGYIEVCFKTAEAVNTVEAAWEKFVDSKPFNLVTYHAGCGHLNGEYRSFFIASQPIFAGNCVNVAAELADETEVMHEVDLTWGTYQHPDLTKRTSTLGHVQLNQPDLYQASNVTRDGTTLPTVDLTHNASAVKYFFGTNSINTDIADEYETGLGFLSDQNDGALVKRGLFSWIVEGINAVLSAIVKLINKVVDNIKTAAEIIVEIAEISVKLIMVPFGVPFDYSYQADINFDDRNGGRKLSTDLGSALGGTENDLVLSKQGAAVQVQCESCGSKAKFSFDGHLAFSISTGVSKAHVSFINHEDFVIDAIYGITVDARALKDDKKGFKTTIEKEIASVPFYAIKIPKILTIGPQVIVNAAASVYVDAHGEFRAGARFTISSGELTLDAMNASRNTATGFTPNLEPIFEIKSGNIIATADLAAPVGVEAALDILGGTWKKSIGIYSSPSVYFTAGYSTGEGHACDKGIELRAGAKNRFYSSALGIWEYEFKALGYTFFETGLGCLSSKGWDSEQVEPTTFFNQEIAAKFGGEENLASNSTIKLHEPGPVIYEDEYFMEENKDDDKNKLRKLPDTNGFRLIQDAAQTATLVSGKDGYLYMVNNSAEYDISAPWGGLKVDENVFHYDVFGRLIWYDAGENPYAMMRTLHVSAAQHMVEGAQAVSLSTIKFNDNQTYGVSFELPEEPERGYCDDTCEAEIGYKPNDRFKSPEPSDFWFPTACQTPEGLRLYATYYIVTKDGYALLFEGDAADVLNDVYEADRKNHKLGDENSCLTVRLTSDPKSTVQQ